MAAARHVACFTVLQTRQTRTMAITNTQPPARPAKDEWGVYDPEQAGLAALFARIDARVKPAASDSLKATQNPAALDRPSLRDAK